jgi:hypothetical protein
MDSSISKDDCKSNKNSSLTKFIDFMKNTFVKSRKIPIISISLFIIVVILNTIQYVKNDPNFLQNKILVSNENYPYGTMNLGNILLFIYDFLSINGFINYTTLYVFIIFIIYMFLSLIEINVGYISLLFLLFIDMIFSAFLGIFNTILCQNVSLNIDITKFQMCCGSFMYFMSLGFVLFLIQNNITNKFYRCIVIFIMLCIWAICILCDRYNNFNNMLNTSNQQTCTIFIWHGANFFFGICCGFSIGNKKTNDNTEITDTTDTTDITEITEITVTTDKTGKTGKTDKTDNINSTSNTDNTLNNYIIV